MNVKDLVKMSMYLAVFAMLDFVAATSGLFSMPQGGSLGLGALALVLASLDLGWRKGVFVALVSVLLQYITSPPVYFVSWLQFLMDYVLAYGVYGLAVIFPLFKFKGFSLSLGVIITNLIRFGLHFLAGIWFYGATWWFSFTYNGWYMIPTLVLTTILTGLLLPRISQR